MDPHPSWDPTVGGSSRWTTPGHEEGHGRSAGRSGTGGTSLSGTHHGQGVWSVDGRGTGVPLGRDDRVVSTGVFTGFGVGGPCGRVVTRTEGVVGKGEGPRGGVPRRVGLVSEDLGGDGGKYRAEGLGERKEG